MLVNTSSTHGWSIEFAGLWKYLSDWQNVFRHFDRDRSGTIEGHELASALKNFGYALSPQLINLVEQKYCVYQICISSKLNWCLLSNHNHDSVSTSYRRVWPLPWHHIWPICPRMCCDQDINRSISKVSTRLMRVLWWRIHRQALQIWQR